MHLARDRILHEIVKREKTSKNFDIILQQQLLQHFYYIYI